MKKLDKGNFHEFISEGDKVVEFYADWCIDCKRIAPDMPSIVDRFSERFEFAEIDVDQSKEIAEEYNVKGIPTFIVYRDGKEVDRLLSRHAKTKEQIESFLDQF